MAKKGISIKELARELGITSRQLIDRCREAGLPAQNSITKLNVVAERQVRAMFASGTSADLPQRDAGTQGEEEKAFPRK